MSFNHLDVGIYTKLEAPFETENVDKETQG